MNAELFVWSTVHAMLLKSISTSQRCVSCWVAYWKWWFTKLVKKMRHVMTWKYLLKTNELQEIFPRQFVWHVGVPVASLHKTTKFNKLASISTRKSSNFCLGATFKIASKLLFSFQTILHSRHKCLNWMLAKSIFSSQKCTNSPVTLIGRQESYTWNI